MKKALTLALVLLGSLGSVFAQPGADELDDVLTAAQAMRTEIVLNATALRSIVQDFIVAPVASPDPAPFLAATASAQSAIEGRADDIIADIGQAALVDPYINPASIQNLASQIEALGDQIQTESSLFAGYVNTGDLPNGTSSAILLRSLIKQQFSLLKQIVEETRFWQQSLVRFDVRIALVDAWGNPVTGSTGLMGYYAYNTVTGEYVYPDYYNPEEFTDLPNGNWTFGAYDGYFDGAGSNNVTLDMEPIGPDGFITVTLVYWSE